MSPLSWKTISATAKPASLDRLEQLFWEAGAVSVTVQDAGDEPILEPGPGETPVWQDIVVTGMFEADVDLAEVQERLVADEFQLLHLDTLLDRPWEREWLAQFKPMAFGERLWVCPTAFDPPEGADVVMYLDPGLAFGTGTHPTTRLCLEWLDAHVRPGMKVIDYGCGSGILGIAALLLGAQSVVAVDNDRQALAASKRNAEANGVSASLSICTPEDVPSGPYDVVMANILAQPLIDLAPGLEGLLGPDGALVLSGIMEGQSDWVKGAYRRIAFSQTSTLDGWACIEGCKR